MTLAEFFLVFFSRRVSRVKLAFVLYCFIYIDVVRNKFNVTITSSNTSSSTIDAIIMDDVASQVNLKRIFFLQF